MKFIFSILILISASVGFAKEAPAPKAPSVERAPSSTAIVSVRTDSMAKALKEISKNPKFKSMIAPHIAAQKDCGGSLGIMMEKNAILTYTGKGGYGKHYSRHLVPMWGGCSGTGMIENVVLFAQVDVYINMEEDKETYQFMGFRQTKLSTSSNMNDTVAFPEDN